MSATMWYLLGMLLLKALLMALWCVIATVLGRQAIKWLTFQQEEWWNRRNCMTRSPYNQPNDVSYERGIKSIDNLNKRVIKGIAYHLANDQHNNSNKNFSHDSKSTTVTKQKSTKSETNLSIIILVFLVGVGIYFCLPKYKIIQADRSLAWGNQSSGFIMSPAKIEVTRLVWGFPLTIPVKVINSAGDMSYSVNFQDASIFDKAYINADGNND